MTNKTDLGWMQQALDLAQTAYTQNEVPIGAIVTLDNQLIAQAHNQTITLNDPTAHAEVCVLRQAAQVLKNYRLLNSTLYVTLEPCAMCAGALIQARVKRLVFATHDPKAGAVSSVLRVLDTAQLNHAVQWSGGEILTEDCGNILRRFFQERRG